MQYTQESRQGAHGDWLFSVCLASGGISESLWAAPSFSSLCCGSCLDVTAAREDSFTTRKEFTREALIPPTILHILGREGTWLLTFLCLPQTAHDFLLGLQHRSQPWDPPAIAIYTRIHCSEDAQIAQGQERRGKRVTVQIINTERMETAQLLSVQKLVSKEDLVRLR